MSADGDNVLLVLNVSEEQRFGLLLYWNQVQGPLKPWWHRNLTGPQTITLNHTDLVPCLCIQVWPLEPDPVRTSICPFKEGEQMAGEQLGIMWVGSGHCV